MSSHGPFYANLVLLATVLVRRDVSKTLKCWWTAEGEMSNIYCMSPSAGIGVVNIWSGHYLGKSISLSGVSGRCGRHECPELDNSSGNMSACLCLIVLTSTWVLASACPETRSSVEMPPLLVLMWPLWPLWPVSCPQLTDGATRALC